MDSVLHTLYCTYFILNGLCVNGEDVQFANKMHEVVIIVKSQEIRLNKLSEETLLKKSDSLVTRSFCKDTDDNSWIFQYDKSAYGYGLFFIRKDSSYQLKVSNRKICVDDHDK